jgi:hypothetical protein
VRLRAVRLARAADPDRNVVHVDRVHHASSEPRPPLRLLPAVRDDGVQSNLLLAMEDADDEHRLDVVGIRSGVGDEDEAVRMPPGRKARHRPGSQGHL